MQKEENILHIKLSLHGDEHICMLHQKNGENRKLMFNVHNIENLDSYTKLLEVIKKYDTVTFNNIPYTTNNIQNTKNLQNIIEDWYANEVALFPKGFSNLYKLTNEEEELKKKNTKIQEENIRERQYGTKVNPFNIKEEKDKCESLFLKKEQLEKKESSVFKAGIFKLDSDGSIRRI